MAAIWLDSSTIIAIANGDRDLEIVVKNSGAPLLMTPKVREEVLVGNPFKDGRWRTPEERARTEAVIQRVGIQLDMWGSAAGWKDSAAVRTDLFLENRFKFFKPEINRREIRRSIADSDAIVLSEVAASAKARGIPRPKLITTETHGMGGDDAKAWGVDISLPDATLLTAVREKRAKLITSIQTMLTNIQIQYKEVRGEHQQNSNLINDTSVVGVIGFWTNHLYNKDVPPLTIWNPAFGAMSTATRLLREGDLAKAMSATLRARGELLKACVVYRRWEDGVEGAGLKMQHTIGVVAAALIVTAAAAFVATAAGTAAATLSAEATVSAEATLSAEAAVNALARTIARGDALAVRVATEASTPAAAAALAEYEAALAEAEEFAKSALEH